MQGLSGPKKWDRVIALTPGAYCARSMSEEYSEILKSMLL